MSDTLLVHGRWLISGAGPDDVTLEHAAVAVRGGEILAVDRFDTLRAQYPQADTLGGADMAVLPGFINAHHHSRGVSTLQQGQPDLLLESWLLSLGASRASDAYLDALLSAGELLRSGVTSVVDAWSGGGLDAEAFDSGCRRALAGYQAAGIRACLAPGISNRNHLLWADEQEPAFIDALPEPLQGVARQQLPGPQAITPEEYLAVVRGLHQDTQDDPRLRIWFGPPGPGWVSDEFLLAIHEAAIQLDTHIQTHALESLYENLHGRRCYGKPTLLHLHQLGVLNPRFSIAHGVWLSEAEIQVMADSGAAISHNPSSNLRLRAGRAPLQALLSAGVTVGLGLDATSLNDDDDIFSEQRLALRLARGPRYQDAVPATCDVFAMATRGGAALLGDHRLGRLAPGYQADLVLLKLERLCWPWVAPEVDPRELVLLRARKDDVDTVLVAGEVVVQGGEPTRFDRRAVGAELAARLASQPEPDLREEYAALQAQLEGYYQSWDGGELIPYQAFNSRQ